MLKNVRVVRKLQIAYDKSASGNRARNVLFGMIDYGRQYIPSGEFDRHHEPDSTDYAFFCHGTQRLGIEHIRCQWKSSSNLIIMFYSAHERTRSFFHLAATIMYYSAQKLICSFSKQSHVYAWLLKRHAAIDHYFRQS